MGAGVRFHYHADPHWRRCFEPLTMLGPGLFFVGSKFRAPRDVHPSQDQPQPQAPSLTRQTQTCVGVSRAVHAQTFVGLVLFAPFSKVGKGPGLPTPLSVCHSVGHGWSRCSFGGCHCQSGRPRVLIIRRVMWMWVGLFNRRCGFALHLANRRYFPNDRSDVM